MSDSTPDQSTLDAWLAGSLSEAERKTVEAWIDEHPEALLAPENEGGAIDESLLVDLPTGGEFDPQITAVMDQVTGMPSQIGAPGESDWKEILTPTDNPEFLGMLGGYQIVEVVATGGMGIVLKAWDPELQRFAALKVLAPDLAANATARARFLREARAAAKLEHDNILPIYQVHDESIPYFTMRFGDGGTLQEKLDRGEEFSIDQLQSIALQTASALVAAHDCGLIHRDIKPANLLFEKDEERLWVCDFGIAHSTDDPSLTYPGTIAGTPQFMSPEQADGTIDLDGRSDLYSLGAVLFRCAAGRHYLEGDTTLSVLDKLKAGTTSPNSDAIRKLPSWFRRLLTNLLAYDREDRPADALAVVRAVESEYAPKPKQAERRNRRWLIGVSSAAGFCIFAWGALQIPVVRDGANHLLALRHEEEFSIAGKIGIFPSLKKAISEAENGDVILLPVDTAILVDNLRIGPGKELTFRSADEEKRPRFTTELRGVHGFVSESSLSFHGIDFVLNAKQDGEGIIIMKGGNLLIENCSFVARRRVKKPYDDTRSRTIQLFGDATTTINQCQFDLQHGNAVTVHEGGSRISIRDTKIAAFFGINLLVSKNPEVETVLDMERCSFTGEHLAKLSFVNRQVPLFFCRMKENDFHLVHSIGWIQANEAFQSQNRFFWEDEGSTIHSGQPVVMVGHFHHMLGRRGKSLPLIPKE